MRPSHSNHSDHLAERMQASMSVGERRQHNQTMTASRGGTQSSGTFPMHGYMQPHPPPPRTREERDLPPALLVDRGRGHFGAELRPRGSSGGVHYVDGHSDEVD